MNLEITLEINSGPRKGERVVVPGSSGFSVGRSESADLVLGEDRFLSSRHFVLQPQDGRCRLRDLGSTNGTLVNGERVMEIWLRNGDRIVAGHTTFVVEIRDGRRVGRVLVSPSARANPRSYDAPEKPVVSAMTPRSSTPRSRSAGLGPTHLRYADPSDVPIGLLSNSTLFPVATFPWEDTESASKLSIVLKATYEILPTVRPAGEQRPLSSHDQPEDAPPGPPPQLESDLVPFKPRADVIIVGQTWPPNGEPVTQTAAGLRVGKLRAAIAVFGDRTWQSLAVGPMVTKPKPFTSMPLTYDRAFGDIDKASALWCPENPIGTGFVGKKSREALHDVPLPNLEDPRQLIRSWDDRPKPVGFGVYGRGWLPRRAYAGTYDEEYQKTRAPLPPKDFSYALFNAAHPDLQVEGYLKGDEEVELLNLHRRHPELRFRLPGMRPKIRIQRWKQDPLEWLDANLDDEGRLPAELPLEEEELKPNLDTLILLPDENQLVEVFRAVTSLRALDSLEVARIIVSA